MTRYLIALRVKEIIGKAGFFMVGVIFAKPDLTIANFVLASHFFIICLVNGLAIYLINAGLGHDQDSSNHRLQELQKINRSRILTAALLLSAISLVWTYLFSSRLLLPSIIVYVIWTLYSLPNGLKGWPITGLLCAFVAQIVHFNIGNLVFSSVNFYSLTMSVYFGLLFAGGHALHEVIDHDADQAAGLKTSSVYFGKKKLFYASNLIFTFAAGYLVAANWMFMNRSVFIAPYLLAFAVQCILMVRLPQNWTTEMLFSYRRKYMIAYMIATILVAVIIYGLNIEYH